MGLAGEYLECGGVGTQGGGQNKGRVGSLLLDIEVSRGREGVGKTGGRVPTGVGSIYGVFGNAWGILGEYLGNSRRRVFRAVPREYLRSVLGVLGEYLGTTWEILGECLERSWD